MEEAQQEAGAAAAAPTFDLLPRKGRRARRAKPAAKTLLPEDHHYKVENLNRYALRPRNAIIAAAPPTAEAKGGGEAGGGGGEAPPFDDGGDFGGFGAGGCPSCCWAGGDALASGAASFCMELPAGL
jgi:hypothetical protein